MKRLQILIDEDVDAALAAQAAREKTSKGALVRRYVAAQLMLPPIEDDPLWGLVGSAPGHRDDSASVDDVVYGPRSSE